MVYLIHFESKYHHAQHYIGFAESDVDARLERHRAGSGSKLLRAVAEADIPFDVVKVWEDGDRTFERKLKNQKKSHRHCPVCNAKKGKKSA
jgi:predicted GIY-YIG superfamily endonuclease